MTRSIGLSAVLALAVSSLAAGCSSDANSASADVGEPRGDLVVFAAASLTDAYTALGADFRNIYPDVNVKFSFAGSQSLRTQIQNGAQPQVFASANAQHTDKLRSQGLVGTPKIFVTNELVVVVPASNPAGIRTFADLPKAKRLVLANEDVPAGAYAKRVLASASTASGLGADFAARVKKSVVSRETHVRQTLQKVILGEADAAIVYATDAAAAGDKIQTISIPAAHNVVASYPVATVNGSRRARLARLFVQFVRSDAAQARLREYGFQPAPARATGKSEVQ